MPQSVTRPTIMRISSASYVLVVFTFFLLAPFANPLCCAQSDRYELGKRVRRFEVAWQTAEPQLRTASTAPMQKAVQNFFSLQFAKAAQQLDDAYFAVRQASPPTPFEQLAIAQRLLVEPVAVDVQAATLRIKLNAFYEPRLTNANAPAVNSLDDATVRLKLLVDPSTIKVDLSLIGCVECSEQVQKRALSRTTVAENCSYVSSRGLKIATFEDRYFVPTFAIRFVDLPRFEHVGVDDFQYLRTT
jgi:hypothetical protein